MGQISVELTADYCSLYVGCSHCITHFLLYFLITIIQHIIFYIFLMTIVHQAIVFSLYPFVAHLVQDI